MTIKTNILTGCSTVVVLYKIYNRNNNIEYIWLQVEEIAYFFNFIQAFGSEAKITDGGKCSCLFVLMWVLFSKIPISSALIMRSINTKIIQLFKVFHVFCHMCWEKITTLEVQYFILKLKYFYKMGQCSLIYWGTRQYQVLIQLLKKYQCYRYQRDNLTAQLLS